MTDGWRYVWNNPSGASNVSYVCGYCGTHTSPSQHFFANAIKVNVPNRGGYIYLCPGCSFPTFKDAAGQQHPAVRMGVEVEGITDDSVRNAYKEARDCTAAGAYTAAVLLCRKILMHLAVQHGAAAGRDFVSYIEHLESKGYVPPNGKWWVDKIRTAGNIATHDIPAITAEQATETLKFTGMLLKFNYELAAPAAQTVAPAAKTT